MHRVIHRLLRPLWFLLAAIFLIEAWLWMHLQPVVAWLVARIPLARFKLWLSGAIARLSPPATLVVFVVPPVLLFPLKIGGLWLAHRGHWLAAAAVIILAKLIGVGVTAFIFEATQPKLVQMAWFRAVYAWVKDMLARAHAIIDPIKLRIKAWLRMFAPKRASRTLRLLWRIRRRVQGNRPAG